MATTDNIPTPNTLGSALSAAGGTTLLINERGEELLRQAVPANEQASFGVLPPDSSWVRQSFITYRAPFENGTPSALLDEQDRFNRRFSTSMLKYTDSSAGGNKYINPPPQWTRYADIRHQRVGGGFPPVSLNAPANHQSHGMGRYYSESTDDNKQIIHMRFGVASFNSLTQFFTGFYSSSLAATARGARYSDEFVTKWSTRAGNVIGLAIAPLFIIPVAILFFGTAARFFLNSPASKFYYLKPSMPQYWSAVSSLVNQMAVNSGLSSYVDTAAANQIGKGGFGEGELKTSQTMNIVGQFLPKGLIKPDGTIDIYAVANRGNRMEIEYQKRFSDVFDNSSGEESWFEIVRKHLSTDPVGNFEPGGKTLEEYLDRFITKAKSLSQINKDDGGAEKDIRSTLFNDATQKYDGARSADPSIIDYVLSNANDGAEWVSFGVDYTGPVNENFSSSTAESALATKMNSISRAARSARFNLADGNLGMGTGVIMEAIKGVVSGVAEVVQVSGLAQLAGNAFVDIPHMWNESVAQLPKINYNVTLISPYGNPVSQLLNIWMPLGMLLAGALPLATGKQSHTSPFLVQLWDRGAMITRLGIIESMTITRGTSNLGFNRERAALAIEVSFSVKDLSSIIAMPIHPQFNVLNPLEGLFDDDNAFTDYLLVLAGTKIGDTQNRIPMLKYQINRKMADMNSFFSASHIGSYLASTLPAQLLGAAMKGTDKQ